jgi:flagellar basal-body rod modification protein FlgD
MAGVLDTGLIESLGYAQKKTQRAANKEMGEDAFLKLIITQLENQDPLKPMDNAEFLSQLAQFKSVTGIDELKTSVDKMATALQSNQALQASSMVGRWVMVPSDKGFMWDQVGMAGSVEVPTSASQVYVTITDKFGQAVHQIDLGSQGKGSVDFQWDGVDVNGLVHPPGEYKVSAMANISGEFEAIETMAIVPVESVVMTKTGADLTVNAGGVGKIKLSDIKEIM